MIQECLYEEIKKWKSKAAKDGVALGQTNNTRWFKYDDIACGALLETSKFYRIKGIYVLPEHRGKGIGEELTDYIINQAQGKSLEVLAYNDKFYLKRGFQFVRMYKEDVYLLRKML